MIIAKYLDVTLREFEEKDIPLKVEWINNPENNQFLHYELPARVDKTINWFYQKDNEKRVDCIIEYQGTPVGVIGLLQIDKVNSKAEYYITIGETSFKGKGIATKATKAILDYGFNILNLHKIYLTVDSRNEIAIKLYKKSGFKCEGYFEDDLFCDRKSEFIDRERYAVIQKQGGGVKLYFEILKRNELKTPVYEIETETENNKIFIKRDDLYPFSFGGNKARKGMLFWKDIKKKKADYIVTYGSSSSNHCRVITNIAASEDMPCCIISPEEIAHETYNSKMMELVGAEIKYCKVSEVHEIIEETINELKEKGYNPYFIQGGGHGNIGTQAYVDCYREIVEYENYNNIHFDYIFHASGTGTTQAGLVCGQLMNGDERKIVGISIARKCPYGRNVVIDSIKEYIGDKFTNDEIEDKVNFIDEYTGDGYGKTNSKIKDEIHKFMIKYGIPLDSTYTAKGIVGMKEYLKENVIKDKNILFIHTGGTPLFFDEIEK